MKRTFSSLFRKHVRRLALRPLKIELLENRFAPSFTATVLG